MKRYAEGGVDLGRVRQAKLSRAEEWSDKWRTKEEVRGRRMGRRGGKDAKGDQRRGETPRVPPA